MVAVGQVPTQLSQAQQQALIAGTYAIQLKALTGTEGLEADAPQSSACVPRLSWNVYTIRYPCFLGNQTHNQSSALVATAFFVSIHVTCCCRRSSALLLKMLRKISTFARYLII